MDDPTLTSMQLGESARRVVDRAIDESKRREHAVLTTTHVFLAFAQVEWELFAQSVGEFGTNPHALVAALEEDLARVPTAAGDLEVAQAARAAFALALQHARRSGRETVEAVDLLAAMSEETHGVAVAALRRQGVEPAALAARITSRLRDRELRDERLRRRFELPPVLRHFATNLNLLACQDRLAPVFGRDREIAQVTEILCHRERSNSVMLVGEPGVGKTAIAEGLARRIEYEPERVPVRMRDSQIVSLQMNSIVAGTMLRGMFEDRMMNVIRELREHPSLILFVDEAHTMIGAGAALGAPADAANVLKSVLARGEVRMIAATTPGEFRTFIQEDEAFARRFRTVFIDEPDGEQSRRLLYDVRPRLERHYAVRIRDEAIDTAIEMAPRYLRHLHMPDKAIGWLDTAAVRAEIDRRWEVTSADVVEVISQAAQIPSDMVFRDVTDRFHDVEERLGRRVVGQRPAIRAVADRLVLNKGPLKETFDRPDGVLLFLGPTGVGKTELAKAVAELLFGDERKMIRVDMSEYQDPAVSVDKLIGMPRGIVGSERGGVLTNRLRDTPYTVLLLDEIEKASPPLLNLFLQAFDEGWLTDGRGRRVYLSDAIVIMTSNLGSEHFRELTTPLGFRAGRAGNDQVRGKVFRELERRFSPEFRNRIDEVIIFDPLTRDDVRRIASLQLDRLAAGLAAGGRSVVVSPEAFDAIIEEGYNLACGARYLKRTIDRRVRLPISQRWREGSRFRVELDEAGIVVVCDGARSEARESEPAASLVH